MIRSPGSFIEGRRHYQTLYITEMEDIVTVTFNRSERRNALTPQMIDFWCANAANTCFS
ncbi:MAG: hypothetical protein RB191_08925 [Terriglobia bacterium]|nr:hypothetical protein [Terriglobia bacterium]